MTKRQKAILKAIDNGNFALCHLFDRFGLSFKTLKKHVLYLESEGMVEIDHEAEHGGTFSTTLKGREYVTPLKLG